MEIISKVNQPEQQASADKLTKHISRHVGKCINDFNMISHDDRVMVYVSVGKDSYNLLDTLIKLQKKATIKFHFTAVSLDQGQPGHSSEILKNYFESLRIEFHIKYQDTFSVVKSLFQKKKQYVVYVLD